MSATGGKVALVNSTTPLWDSCTVLIRPFGGSAPTLYAVLKIRR
jgi:hypothetical protein